MKNIKQISSTYKVFALISFIFLFLWSLFFFLKPEVSEGTHKQESIVSPSNVAVSNSTLNQHFQGEAPHPVSALNSKPSVTGSEDSVLFDTKSDMTIQPVDPNTDPANKVDNN